MKYLNSMGGNNKSILITDYELKRQDINGIDVIEKSNMKESHVLVTNKYLSDIKEFEEKSNFLKVLYKVFLNEIPFVID